jgi:HAD superfamily hydrolase (TIGR01509 family)
MIRAVLFDMDGVLVDSEEFIRNAAIQMFLEKGFVVEPEDFIPFIGAGEIRFLGGVAEKYGIELEIDEAKTRTYLIYEKICSGNLRALPGVFEVMELCRDMKLKTAVTTSADEFKMLVNLKEIGLPVETFDLTVFADMVINKKPDPEIFLTASGMLGLEPGECLVIEDSPSGLKAARAAGMRSIGLSTTFDPAELALADRVLPDLSHVKRKDLV